MELRPSASELQAFAIEHEMEDTARLEPYCNDIPGVVVLLDRYFPLCLHPPTLPTRADYTHHRIRVDQFSLWIGHDYKKGEQGGGAGMGEWYRTITRTTCKLILHRDFWMGGCYRVERIQRNI